MTDEMDPRSKGKRELTLDLPAAHSAVPQARNVLRRFVRTESLVDEEVETLMLVASELLGNAVDHGGGGAAMDEGEVEDVRMHLAFEMSETDWVLSVTDQGGGNPSEVERLVREEEMPDLEDERGRGFYLIARMVDRVEVRRSQDGRGLTIVVFRKHVRP